MEYPGAFYHVICRGNQQQAIFRDNRDRKYYLQRLETYRKRYGFTLYAYVLMSNHVHLLIETGEIPLSKVMQGCSSHTLDANLTSRGSDRGNFLI